MKKELKALNIYSVQLAAEDIMLKKGWTTTLEVKEQLRREGFYAIQVEVSSAMDFLAWENKWSFQCNGQYRIYQFSEDTEMALYTCLERGEQVWEIAVSENYQIIRVGKKQQKFSIAKHCYDSNRQALIEAGRLINLREQEDFKIVNQDEQFAAQLLEYFDFLANPLLQCTLYFHSIEKVEQQRALFCIDGIQQIGYIETCKKAGYEFTFDFNSTGVTQLLRSILQRNIWTAPQMEGISSFLLGEKELHKTVLLASGEPTEERHIKQYASCKHTKAVQVKNNCLYRVDIQYKDGNKLILRRDDFEEEGRLMELTQCLLRSA